MTPARRTALETGQAIRNILCMDSIAQRYFELSLRHQVREICDQQMNILGYESITAHRKRISDIWGDPKANTLSDREYSKLMKYKKIL